MYVNKFFRESKETKNKNEKFFTTLNHVPAMVLEHMSLLKHELEPIKKIYH